MEQNKTRAFSLRPGQRFAANKPEPLAEGVQFPDEQVALWTYPREDTPTSLTIFANTQDMLDAQNDDDLHIDWHDVDIWHS